MAPAIEFERSSSAAWSRMKGRKREREGERERERNRFEKADGGGSVHAGGRWLRGRTYIIT